MQLQTVRFTFELLTPCFSGTALGDKANDAEIRVPPIRGHVRFWHRELFGADDCNRIWGSTSGEQGKASLVALRLVGSPLLKCKAAPLLPHDKAKSKAQRPALPPKSQYTIVLQRLAGCNSTDCWDRAQRALKAWLLLGCLGLRANRAAGSVWPIGDWVPTTGDALRKILKELGLNKWQVAIIGFGVNLSPDELRETASDTIKDNTLGHIFGGIKPERTPSPTKFKVIRLGQQHCLLACAPKILSKAESLLNSKPDPKRWQKVGKWDYIYP